MTENNDTQLEMDIKKTLMRAKATQDKRATATYGSLRRQIQDNFGHPLRSRY